MKTNVKMIDKSKNSFIYFQLGLIATMVAVLFVLEINFETKAINQPTCSFPINTEEIFVYNPKMETPKVKLSNPIIQKDVVQKVVQPKVINQFIESKVEVNDDLVKETTHQETDITKSESVKPTDNAITDTKPIIKTDEVYIVVEFLPMFPNCIGVSKEQQKECFDRALKTEIFKHLKYPEKDLENNREGTVFVQFIIDESGNFIAIKSADNNRSSEEMKLAVENAVKKLPKIIPAKQGNKDVKIKYTIPVVFKIN